MKLWSKLYNMTVSYCAMLWGGVLCTQTLSFGYNIGAALPPFLFLSICPTVT